MTTKDSYPWDQDEVKLQLSSFQNIWVSKYFAGDQFHVFNTREIDHQRNFACSIPYIL